MRPIKHALAALVVASIGLTWHTSANAEAPPAAPASPPLQPQELTQAKNLAKTMLGIIHSLPADVDEQVGEGQLAAAINASGASPPVILEALKIAEAEPNLPAWAITAIDNLRSKHRFGVGAVTYGGEAFPNFNVPGGSDY